MEHSNSTRMIIPLAALFVIALLAAVLPFVSNLGWKTVALPVRQAAKSLAIDNLDQDLRAQAGAAPQSPAVVPPALPGYQPGELPAHITDLRLLQAWLHLYQSQAGRRYAEFIREEKIPLVWGEEMGTISGMVVKSVDASGRWLIAESAPIKINASLADSGSIMLATVIAHEAYHYSQPFGPVASSLYEEFRALALEDQIWREAKAQLSPTPAIYDPYKETDLIHFFAEHGELTGSRYYALYRQGSLSLYPTSWNSTSHGK